VKRFFCTICGKIRHVRVLPPGVDTFQTNISKRTGECRWHSSGVRHPRMAPTQKYVRVKAPPQPIAPSPKNKAKRGGK